jgi:hypothetical protein
MMLVFYMPCVWALACLSWAGDRVFVDEGVPVPSGGEPLAPQLPSARRRASFEPEATAEKLCPTAHSSSIASMHVLLDLQHWSIALHNLHEEIGGDDRTRLEQL